MINNLKNFIIFFIFFTGLYFIFIQNLEFNFTTKIILIYLYFTISISILSYYYTIRTQSNLPIFTLTNIYFLFCYLGLFIIDKHKIFPSFRKNDYIYAIQIFFYGYTAFIVGYFILTIIFKNLQRKGFNILNVADQEVFIFGIFLISSSILFYYILNIQEHFYALSQIKYPILLLGNGLLVLFIATDIKEKNFYFKKIICFFLIIIPILNEIINGAYSFPFLLIFLNYVFYSYIKKKIYISPFILIILLFNFVHLGKTQYRNITWKKDYQNVSNVKKASIFFNIYKDMTISGIHKFNKEVLCLHGCDRKASNNRYYYKVHLERIIFPRIFHSIKSLLIVTKNTPNTIPYWNGYSYNILKSKIIPRIFWKNKPSDRLGNEFGHRYNILNKKNVELGTNNDNTTSWNMPFLNELYVNFGPPGVIWGMFFIGIIFGIITKISTFQNKKNIEGVILFFVFIPLFFLESHASLIFGAVMQSYIFLMIISIFFIYCLRIIRKKNEHSLF